MADTSKSKTLAALALWHLCLAVKLLQRICRRGGSAPSDPAAKPSLKPDELIAGFPELSPANTKEAADTHPQLSSSVSHQPVPDQIRSGDYLTIDVVEIRGRLGTNDHRELKINTKPPIKLNRREHTLLLILAWLAKCAATASKAGRNQLPAFLPVKAILDIILKLTAEGGLLAGRWPYPIESDIYRCVAKLRRRLRERGFNPNLIESGQRLAGYRLSTPVSNIVLDAAAEPPEKFWAGLFDSVLGARGGSGEEGSRGG
ncbi:MAG: hypothetical protein ABSD29_03655 [Verrucomicrobiota bacterium]|jgi:hypothetical protein